MTAAHAGGAERWVTDVVGESVAVLDIPGALDRRRVFDIDVTLTVHVPREAEAPWHELGLEIDGRRQWTRRIKSSQGDQTDGLDYHCRLTLDTGRALRVRAVCVTRACRVARLLIEAQEDR